MAGKFSEAVATPSASSVPLNFVNTAVLAFATARSL